MALTLVFLGRLEDVAGAAELRLDTDSPLDLSAIAARLDPAVAEAILGDEVRIARNGALVAAGDLRAGDGDEVAFLPPVSGG